MKILESIMGTLNNELTFGEKPEDNTLMAYADANYLDSRCSVSGGVVTLGGAAVAWFSRMKRVTALSTTEVEYMTLEEVSKEIMFFRQVQGVMAPSLVECCVTVLEYNEGATKMADNPISSH